MSTFKQQVQEHFLKVLQDKIADIQRKLDDLKDSLTNETKSTAGDKHETARAFVHIEQANTAGQLDTLLQQKAALERLSGSATTDKIMPGSLVLTDKGYLYLSEALGKTAVEGTTVFALSPQSPLGQLLLGCNAGQVIQINTTSYRIETIQ